MHHGVGQPCGQCHLFPDERQRTVRPLYEKYAEVTIDIDGLSVRDAARQLVDKLSMR